MGSEKELRGWVGRRLTCSLPQNLQETLGLSTGLGNKDSVTGNPEGKGVWGTKETPGEEEEEEITTAPTSSSSPVPSPSPTPEDAITYICEYPEARMACMSITDPTGGQTHQGSPRSPDMPVKSPNH